MCEPSTIALVIAGVSAAVSAKSAYDNQKVATGVARNNAAIAEERAKQIESQGEKDAQAAMRQARQVMGAQRAAYSARGVDISDGTPADIIDATDFFGQSDAATARNNARRQAWATRAYGQNATAGMDNPWSAAGASLLSSAGSVANKWYAAQG